MNLPRHSELDRGLVFGPGQRAGPVEEARYRYAPAPPAARDECGHLLDDGMSRNDRRPGQITLWRHAPKWRRLLAKCDDRHDRTNS